MRNRRAYPAIALTTDTSLLTAAGNDFGFDHVFARQVEALARPGDLLIIHSTSGNSPNVLLAAEAREGEGRARAVVQRARRRKAARAERPLDRDSHRPNRSRAGAASLHRTHHLRHRGAQHYERICKAKRALITGGSRGIGAATAQLFAEYGVHVAIGYRSRKADADALVDVAARRATACTAFAHASDISTRGRRRRAGRTLGRRARRTRLLRRQRRHLARRRRRARRHDRRAVASHDVGERRFDVLHDARGDPPHRRRRTHRARLEHGRAARRGVSRRLRGVEGRDDLVREVAGAGARRSATSR